MVTFLDQMDFAARKRMKPYVQLQGKVEYKYSTVQYSTISA